MIELTSLLVHNDIRLHPQRPSRRNFAKDEGYRMFWFPPHVFVVEVDYEHGGNKETARRFFASTNVEVWETDQDMGTIVKELDKRSNPQKSFAKEK